MIIDCIENTKLYNNINDRINKAFEYIKSTDFTNIKPGKYLIDGEIIYASVSQYLTKDKLESKPEAHRKYLDVQYIIEGNELIGYAPLDDQEIAVAYLETNDIAFYTGEVSFLRMKTGMFMILFPGDLHQPCIKEETSTFVRKVVVKVKMN